ncbi:MAG: hypothetical protein KC493_13435, partial [Bacteriovoracaceae bacterium]|nr:hypothetical protein [Bacteriovoracaceae bacterium]
TSTVNFYFSDNTAEALTLNADDPGSLTAGTLGHTIDHDVATALVYNTEPATGAAGSAMVTQPIVHIHDQFGNLVTSDSTSVITILPKKNSNCNGPATTGSFSNNTATASSGVATFSNLTFSAAETPVYARAETGALTVGCSAMITINAALTISPSSTTVSPSGAQTFTAVGGAGTISFSIPTNNSGASFTSAAYTCNTVDTCIDYQAGATPSVDTVRATDQASVTADSTVTVSSIAELSWDATPSPAWGTVGGNTTKTFTLRNVGSATSGTITVALQDGTNRFSITTDNCSTTTLAAAATCTVTVNFDGVSGGAKSASDVLDAGATPGGSVTLSLTGTKP